jgi:copper(I)-binding protein
MACNSSTARAALLWVLGCWQIASSAAALPGITVTDAWIRWLPANLPAGGYLTLRNDGDQPAALTAVSSPDFRDITLHRTSLRASVSSMQPVAQIAIAAHQAVSFAADGYHIMLEHPTRSVQPGDRVSITLHFADGAAVTVPFEVRRPDAANPP